MLSIRLRVNPVIVNTRLITASVIIVFSLYYSRFIALRFVFLYCEFSANSSALLFDLGLLFVSIFQTHYETSSL